MQATVNRKQCLLYSYLDLSTHKAECNKTRSSGSLTEALVTLLPGHEGDTVACGSA